LLTLENEHILQVKKGAQGGWFVRNDNIDQVATYLGRYLSIFLNSNQITSAHLMEIRSMVEVKGCGLAALRRTPEDIQAIAAALPTGEDLSDYEYHSQDIEFHRCIAQATHNPMLIITIQATTMAQELYAMTTPAPEKIRQELNQTLMDIYQAIVQQDVRKAEEAMKIHLGYYKRMTANIHF
jgi:GntR family transcriptional repressor for pyruvate dehydrogenase complex